MKTIQTKPKMNKNNRYKLHVVKRDGSIQPVRFDEITDRLVSLCDISESNGGPVGLSPLDSSIDVFKITNDVFKKIVDGISTKDIDNFTAKICSSEIDHPDYNSLAARIMISGHHKNIATYCSERQVSFTFSGICKLLYENNQYISGQGSIHCPMVSTEFYNKVSDGRYDDILDHRYDYLLDYFGISTLLQSYLLKVIDPKTNEFVVIETPQCMFLRVAVALHDDYDKVKETYTMMATKKFVHASPTLFNAGTPNQQLFSCFILNMADSIEGIFKCITDIAKISKFAGGIGVSLSDIRGSGSYIRGTGGRTDGIVPLLKVLDDTARYINQGGRRKGSIAVYLEPWHIDVFDFLLAKYHHTATEKRAVDLFYAMWVPDLFISRVKSSSHWSLMCPSECPGLTEAYGTEFEELYTRYEKEGRYRKQVPAVELWNEIIRSQIENGVPYISYKDSVNNKSNHKNLGTIKSSNLCVAPETRIFTDKGYMPIKDLKDQPVKVWNGSQWSDTIVRQTGINQKLLEVIFSNGSVINCTEYHKFYIKKDNGTVDKETVIIEAKDLKEGHVLIDYKLPFNNIKNVSVVSVKDHGRYDDTYCVNEPLENKVIFEGIITSNCNEISEYNTPDRYACCCLASMILPTYVKTDANTNTNFFDYEELCSAVRVVVRNLNIAIDINKYPVIETKISNMDERPLGIGVQGLADVFFKMSVPYDSPEAEDLNKKIFETIYYAAVSESCELAKANGAYKSMTYEWAGKGPAPISQGIFQFDMWSDYNGFSEDNLFYKDRWSQLRQDVKKYGVRNSLLTALMPTASTSHIMSTTAEAFEPVSSNLYTRKVLSGEFIVFNRYLFNDLNKLGLWNARMRDLLVSNRGSVQSIKEIPENIRNVYKTAYELKQKSLINLSAGRAPFVDQTQSLNLFFENPTNSILSSAHFYSHQMGLKTGIYYTRSKPATNAESFTAVIQEKEEENKKEDDDCVMCSG